jgi:hypothetical protein
MFELLSEYKAQNKFGKTRMYFAMFGIIFLGLGLLIQIISTFFPMHKTNSNLLTNLNPLYP